MPDGFKAKCTGAVYDHAVEKGRWRPQGSRFAVTPAYDVDLSKRGPSPRRASAVREASIQRVSRPARTEAIRDSEGQGGRDARSAVRSAESRVAAAVDDWSRRLSGSPIDGVAAATRRMAESQARAAILRPRAPHSSGGVRAVELGGGNRWISMSQPPLFDLVALRDPVSGLPLEPLISARTPAGVPVCGALRVSNTASGYPIVDCIARLTPELARKHARWLEPFGLTPAGGSAAAADAFQTESTVDSFGWQWTWNSAMRRSRSAHEGRGTVRAHARIVRWPAGARWARAPAINHATRGSRGVGRVSIDSSSATRSSPRRCACGELDGSAGGHHGLAIPRTRNSTLSIAKA